MIPSFFRTTKYKRFEYQYRHFDEDKERHERLAKKYSKRSSSFSEDELRADLRSHWDQKRRSSDKSMPNVRVVLIIALLAGLSYLILS